MFNVLTDVTKNASWSSTAVEGRLITPGPMALNTTAREVSVFLGRRIQVDSQIVAFDSNRRFANVTSSGPFGFSSSFAVEPADSDTRVTATFEAKLGHFFKVGDSLFAIVGSRKFKRDLATLKRLMEAGKL